MQSLSISLSCAMVRWSNMVITETTLNSHDRAYEIQQYFSFPRTFPSISHMDDSSSSRKPSFRKKPYLNIDISNICCYLLLKFNQVVW